MKIYIRNSSQNLYFNNLHTNDIEAENFMEYVLLDAICILGAQPGRDHFDRSSDDVRRLDLFLGDTGGELIIENQEMYHRIPRLHQRLHPLVPKEN